MTTKMWITSYALTAGIEVREGRVSDGFFHPEGRTFSYFRVGRDAHPTMEEAVKAAELARQKKIASLKKQLAKLEKLNFTV